jgi:hypothetical protein
VFAENAPKLNKEALYVQENSGVTAKGDVPQDRSACPPSGNSLAMAMDRQIDEMRSYPVFCCHFNFDGGPYYTPEHLLSEEWRR